MTVARKPDPAKEALAALRGRLPIGAALRREAGSYDYRPARDLQARVYAEAMGREWSDEMPEAAAFGQPSRQDFGEPGYPDVEPPLNSR